MSGLPPEAHHLRSEIARRRIRRDEITRVIGMHPNMISALLNEARPMPRWAGHNLGYAVNTITKLPVFNVDMQIGVLSARSPVCKLR
jgi:hypothetical protein